MMCDMYEDDWNVVNTEQDIEDFLNQTGCMADSFMVSAQYATGCGEADDGVIIGAESEQGLKLTFTGCWFRKLEIVFEGVFRFYMGRSSEIWECGLEFNRNLKGRVSDERFIVWSDKPQFSVDMFRDHKIDLRNSEPTVVIAVRMKWRLTPKDKPNESHVFKYYCK